MRYFPINEGKRILYNNYCKKLKVEREVLLVHDGFMMDIDPNDNNQSYIWWYGRYTDIDETKIIKHLLQEGDCFFDVGANIGYYSLVAASLVGKSGKVVSFEPNPLTFKHLKRNIILNNFDQVKTYQNAVGETMESLPLYFNNGSDLCASLLKTGHKHSVHVKKITLDKIVQEQRTLPTMIKIDTEGYDEMVLCGARTILSCEKAPILLIEALSSQAEIFVYLTSLGYESYVLSKHFWVKQKILSKDCPCNTLWIRKDNFKRYEKHIKSLLIL